MNTAHEAKLRNNDELITRLTEEISKLSALLPCLGLNSDTTRENCNAKRPNCNAKQGNGALLLGKMVQGFNLQDWKRLAAENDLRSWLALPVDARSAESMAIVRALLEQLIYQRDHDALTGLANRRYFDNCLAAELERARRNQTALSLAMLDLDNFKFINDTYGHPCGDQVLREVARFLTTNSRAFELIARIGGDEFAIVLPASNGRHTRQMLERLCRNFAAHPIQCEFGGEFCINFSAGIGVAGPERGYPEPKALFEQADQALYEAKRKGKNQVSIAPENDLGSAECLVLSHEKKFLFSYPE